VISFIYSKNNSGPKTVPWGTPEVTGNQEAVLAYVNQSGYIYGAIKGNSDAMFTTLVVRMR